MIELLVIAAAAAKLHCAPTPPKPRPVYTRAQRLKDSFDALAKQPVSAGFLYEIK